MSLPRKIKLERYTRETVVDGATTRFVLITPRTLGFGEGAKRSDFLQRAMSYMLDYPTERFFRTIVAQASVIRPGEVVRATTQMYTGVGVFCVIQGGKNSSPIQDDEVSFSYPDEKWLFIAR